MYKHVTRMVSGINKVHPKSTDIHHSCQCSSVVPLIKASAARIYSPSINQSFTAGTDTVVVENDLDPV